MIRRFLRFYVGINYNCDLFGQQEPTSLYIYVWMEGLQTSPHTDMLVRTHSHTNDDTLLLLDGKMVHTWYTITPWADIITYL